MHHLAYNIFQSRVFTYSDNMHSDWLNLANWIVATNHIALFKSRVVTLLWNIFLFDCLQYEIIKCKSLKAWFTLVAGCSDCCRGLGHCEYLEIFLFLLQQTVNSRWLQKICSKSEQAFSIWNDFLILTKHVQTSLNIRIVYNLSVFAKIIF